MDPDTLLAEIKDLVEEGLEEPTEALALELSTKFRDLDDWIVSGGFFPDAWTDRGYRLSGGV